MTLHFQEDDRFVLGQIDSNVKALLATSLTHDDRLRSLERHRWYQRGFILGVGGLLIAKFPFLSEYFK